MQYLTTQLCLPPGVPPSPLIRDFLRLTLEEYRWFSPARFGFAHLDGRVDASQLDLDALLAFYEERQTLMVAARTDRDFFLIYPAKADSPPYTGTITWQTSAKAASKASWRAAHVEQVTALMRMLASPLARTSLDEDLDCKTYRWVDQGNHQERVFTVRDYSEGLAGLFWRNFFGPPFIRLFGQRLDSLPPDCVQRLGEELALVQPYEKPSDAGSPEAVAREQHLISLLGPDCFYDYTHHTLPTRRPQLPPP